MRIDANGAVEGYTQPAARESLINDGPRQRYHWPALVPAPPAAELTTVGVVRFVSAQTPVRPQRTPHRPGVDQREPQSRVGCAPTGGRSTEGGRRRIEGVASWGRSAVTSPTARRGLYDHQHPFRRWWPRRSSSTTSRVAHQRPRAGDRHRVPTRVNRPREGDRWRRLPRARYSRQLWMLSCCGCGCLLRSYSSFLVRRSFVDDQHFFLLSLGTSCCEAGPASVMA